MNPHPDKNKLLDDVLGGKAQGDSENNLPGFLAEAIRQRRRRRIMLRAAAVTGATLAVVGLGFVAFQRTHSPEGSFNPSIAKASIHESVTSAPKVRTRKFQAEVVKTKDRRPVPKVSPHDQPAVEIVTTSRWEQIQLPTADLAIVSSASDESFAHQIAYVTTTAGNYHLLNDEALLASLAPRAVMLTRDAAGVERLIFINPAD